MYKINIFYLTLDIKFTGNGVSSLLCNHKLQEKLKQFMFSMDSAIEYNLKTDPETNVLHLVLFFLDNAELAKVLDKTLITLIKANGGVIDGI